MNYNSVDSEEQILFVPSDNNKVQSNSNPKSFRKSMAEIRYKDYYEWMGSAKEVRPITVTENVTLSAMSWSEKFWWWLKTCVQMLTLTVLSLRTDRLFDWEGYLKHHWKHYLGKKGNELLYNKKYTLNITITSTQKLLLILG